MNNQHQPKTNSEYLWDTLKIYNLLNVVKIHFVNVIARKTSPTPSRLTPEPPVEKDEGISDEEDPAELRLLLELNEQVPNKYIRCIY